MAMVVNRRADANVAVQHQREFEQLTLVGESASHHDTLLRLVRFAKGLSNQLSASRSTIGVRTWFSPKLLHWYAGAAVAGNSLLSLADGGCIMYP